MKYLILCVIFIAGCTCPPKTQVITHKQVNKLEVPASLMVPPSELKSLKSK